MRSVIPDEFHISEEEFLGFFRAQTDWVERCIADGDHGDWTPHLTAAVRPWGDLRSIKYVMHALAVDFNEAHEKRTVMRSIGRKLYEAQEIPVAAVLTSEAWRAPDEKGVEPRRNPQRSEILMAAGSSLGEKHVAHDHMPIDRGPDGKIRPAKFCELLTEGLTFPILRHFFAGFFETVAAKAGIEL